MNKSFSLNDYGVYTVTESFKTNFHIPIPYSRLILHLTIECFPFCENYAKLYFNVKYFEKGLNRREGVKLLEPFFHKKVRFQANIECCPRFLKYALYSIIITTESYPWLPWSWYDKVFFIFYFSNIMVVSKSSEVISFEALLKSMMKVHKLEKILIPSDERKKLFTEKWKRILQNL